MQILHDRKDDGIFLSLLILIGSIPSHFIFKMIVDENDSIHDKVGGFHFLVFLKAIRMIEIPRFINSAEKVLFYKSIESILAIKFFENFIWLFLIIHFSGCVWLVVNFFIEEGGSKYIFFSSI